MALNREFVKLPDVPGFHVYNGITFPSFIPASNLDALKTWKVRDDDIFCITYPKSGTHWILEIVSLIVNGGDVTKIDRSHMAIGPELSMAHPTDLEAIKAVTPGYKLIDDWTSPRVIATHMPAQIFPPDAWKKKVKMIYFARNLKDVMCSAASFTLPLLPPELQDFTNYIRYSLLCDEVPFGRWSDHVKGYIPHHTDENFLFLKYEDCQKDLVGVVKRISTFLERPVSDEMAEKIAVLSTMKEMKKSYDKHEEEDPEGKMHTRAFGLLKYLNKGKVGNWKEKIKGDLNELVDTVYKERMADSGLEFDFEI